MTDADEALEATRRRFEIWFGLGVAFFAAILALNELASGKYGDDELQLAQEKTSAYLWYQSKGIKQTLVEGQRDLLKTLITGGSIPPEKSPPIEKQIDSLDKKVARYDKDKNEILLGSSAVGKENWSQEVDGQLGQVVGAKELESRLLQLGKAGDRFDLATLFLQLALVLGAIGIVITQPRMKKAFMVGLVGLGVIGSACSVIALRTAGFL